LGTVPRELVDCRCWRRHWLAVLSTRQTSPAPSFRCPRPRTSRTRCNRGMCILVPRAFQSMMSSRQYNLPQYWKENMPKAAESGRVTLQGSLTTSTVTIPVSAQLTLVFPRPRLLHPTACTARGYLCVPSLPNNARLV
jgi:hypothetical protein